VAAEAVPAARGGRPAPRPVAEDLEDEFEETSLVEEVSLGDLFEVAPSGGRERGADRHRTSAGAPRGGHARAGGDDGHPVIETVPDSPAAIAVRGIADTLAQRGRNLAGMQLGLTPSSKF